jgi:hypothetical protein
VVEDCNNKIVGKKVEFKRKRNQSSFLMSPSSNRFLKIA